MTSETNIESEYPRKLPTHGDGPVWLWVLVYSAVVVVALLDLFVWRP